MGKHEDDFYTMCSKHPNAELLAAYATGRAPAGVSMAVASHLTFCPECREEVTRLEALCGAMVAAEAVDDAPDLSSVLARLDDDGAEAISYEPTPRKGPLPEAVAQAVGCDFDSIPWRFRLPGVSEYEFESEDGETISLLRVKPGAKIPQHTHEAEELTVVFDGELLDGEARYGVGDIAIADPSVDHHPRAGGDRPCICLAVLTGGLKFTGPFGRALNLFA